MFFLSELLSLAAFMEVWTAEVCCSAAVNSRQQPSPALQSQERGGGLVLEGVELWVRNSWTNRVKRGRQEEREKPSFSPVCHVIWANPLISGRWLFRPSGCWVSVTDEKKRAGSTGIWGRPRAKDELSWERGRRSGSTLIWSSDWLKDIKRIRRLKALCVEAGFPLCKFIFSVT